MRTDIGPYQIRGCKAVPGPVKGGLEDIMECEDEEAEFFGVYRENEEGLHMHVEDFNERETAEAIARCWRARELEEAQ